jgi:tetratricopeptide (TPR) repeat protein
VEADLTRTEWQAGADEYIRLIRHAQAAADAQPDNITYRYWLPVYRWRAVSQVAEPNATEILQSPEGREIVTRIVAELNEARACCPTFGATWSVLGQLERLVSDPDKGMEHIQTGYTLAPCDPTACLVTGSLDAELGKVESAFAKLRRAVRLDANCYLEVARLLIDDLKRPDLALEVASEQPRLAGQLVSMLDGDSEYAAEVDKRLLDMLEQRCSDEDAAAYWHAMLAEMRQRQGDLPRAVESFRKALALDYGHIQWRLRLAQLLADQGLVDEAIHEAQICLRLSPGNHAAERLLERLSVVRVSQGNGR